MSHSSDCRSNAEKFAGRVSDAAGDQFGEDVIAAYMIGSLAHGGFSRRYNDIDVAFITNDGFDASQLASIRGLAKALDPGLATKLSIFWSDRNFTIGRLPALDRIDLLDHGRTLYAHDAIMPPRPTHADVRTYLAGRPFTTWVEKAQAFASAERLEISERKAYLRALLYPARFTFSWQTAQIASNDAAVSWLHDHPGSFDVDLITRSLECRRAEQDPDTLFAERRKLLNQMMACTDLMKHARGS